MLPPHLPPHARFSASPAHGVLTELYYTLINVAVSGAK